VNRKASVVVRTANKSLSSDDETLNCMPILYYLVSALSRLPYYWGPTTRAVQLTEEEVKSYTPGDIVLWTQFSSSKKGNNSFVFGTRNTYFYIQSLTGRAIKQFSNFKEEDEVLYLPQSTFLVLDNKFDSSSKKNMIYLRQIEIGMTPKVIMWVDDNILNENWENKKHMEEAAANQINLNVHFIPKTSTELAIAFLTSAFGHLLMNKPKFRIISDMTRTNEKPSHNAGARFLRQLRSLGFQNSVLIFTSNKQTAEQLIKEQCGAVDKNVQVSTSVGEAKQFISFH